MGIYLPNMEMPTEYGRCMVIFPDGRVTTEFGSQVIAKAVPVPPHGRLIDADELFNQFEENGWYDNCDRDEIAETLLLNAPTIIPASEEEEDANDK